MTPIQPIRRSFKVSSRHYPPRPGFALATGLGTFSTIMSVVSAISPRMATDGFSIRPATEDDLARMLAIETRVHPAPWSLENFRAELTKPFARLLVMTDDETDEQIAG